MFGLLAYSIAALVIAGLIQLARGLLTRYNHGEGGGPLQLVLTWFVVMALPYIWVESVTAIHGKDFEGIVDEIGEKQYVDGQVAYFKVLYTETDHAKLIVVSNGDYQWGGTYRNIYDVRLDREGNSWVLNGVDPINTSEGDSAGFTLPPYW